MISELHPVFLSTAFVLCSYNLLKKLVLTMCSSAARAHVWISRSLLEHKSSHCGTYPLGELESTEPPSYHNPFERLPSSRLLLGRSKSPDITIQTANTATPSPKLRSAYKKPIPRHVPIIITQNIIDAALKKLPDSPNSPKCDPPAKFSTTTLEIDGQPASLHRPERQRHIPIVIPEFAQPRGIFPPTPSESECSTPRPCISHHKDLSTPPSSISSPMTRIRSNTLDSRTSGRSSANNHLQNTQAVPRSQPVAMDSSQSSFNHDTSVEHSQAEQPSIQGRGVENSSHTSGPMSAASQQPQTIPGTTNLSGLVCNVHKCTGKEPHALIGASTTILGDKLYVFGGRRMSQRRTLLTADLYELDLIRRHWTKLETTGDVPQPRYFHSMCALGDSKLVCYGGMSPGPSHVAEATQQSQGARDQQSDVVVMSDIHIYDAHTRRWTYLNTTDNPQGRYAHCATILPSSAVFTSANAPLSAIHHNPSSDNPNQGSIGVALDGTGGAEMVIVGGQDGANHYIEQICVFNLRSLKWTATQSLGRSCGSYRSVVAPLRCMSVSKIGAGNEDVHGTDEARRSTDVSAKPVPMLIYSNYNFLDVKLDLQVRLPDGSLIEKTMQGQFSPPGLRFPNGGVLDHHLVVSGTYLTSSKREYALWALDLRNLTWSRIDVGGNIFSQGSWNRGVIWSRRNTFVILGNQRRSLVDDYSRRRINFSNVCLVELEAFGLYDNPRHADPTSSYTSFSAPTLPASLRSKSFLWSGGGRTHYSAAEDLGQLALGLRELADMDIISISGERIPVNSHLLARRWGPYFVHLLRESAASTSSQTNHKDSISSDSATVRPLTQVASRTSSITITPSINTIYSAASTIVAPSTSIESSTLQSNSRDASTAASSPSAVSFKPPTSINLPPISRSRTLFLPHTPLTLQALLHYLYTSSLPPPTHPLSTPQILCSLLQLARPYHIDGLLEAVLERLHQVMDGRNAAAVFNASAMAAGGGRGTGFDRFINLKTNQDFPAKVNGHLEHEPNGIHVTDNENLNGTGRRDLRIDTSFLGQHTLRHQGSRNGVDESEDEGSVSGSVSQASSVTDGSEYLTGDGEEEEEIWSAERSCVVGLQKRGLRGLMEGRRLRERGRSVGVPGDGERVALGA